MHSNAFLAEVTCTWESEAISAAVVHSAHDMLVLEATDPSVSLPSIGTALQVSDGTDEITGRLAEHGRGGRFLVAIGDRPVRRSLRLKVSLAATLRGRTLQEPQTVEIVDLTAGGARLRGVELPVGTSVTLDFTPPYRHEPVSVRAIVAHGTHGAERPWIGVEFRLVALRGGR
jgi:PilZ domain